MRNSLVYLAIFLAVVCLASAASLAVTHGVADPLIQQYKAEQRAAALNRALPAADTYEDVTEEYSEYLEDPAFADIDEITRAYEGGNPIGYVFTVSATGYEARIALMVGASRDEITAVRILDQAETPGLGARIAEEEFQGQFSGLSAREQIATVADGGQIDALTGATESTLAVIAGAEQARLLYEKIREEG